jgi:rubrerythrin
MAGGIDAWNGHKAFGPPDTGVVVFSDADKSEDLIALAWILEEGSRQFYEGLISIIDDDEGRSLYRELVSAEERHKEALVRLYQEVSGGPVPSDFPGHSDARDIMEGGVSVSKALEWAEGKEPIDLVQFSMSLEINAYDLYLKMANRLDRAASKKVFSTLAKEEEAHLKRMGELLGKQV